MGEKDVVMMVEWKNTYDKLDGDLELIKEDGLVDKKEAEKMLAEKDKEIERLNHEIERLNGPSQAARILATDRSNVIP